MLKGEKDIIVVKYEASSQIMQEEGTHVSPGVATVECW